jgi:hypothetical protein
MDVLLQMMNEINTNIITQTEEKSQSSHEIDLCLKDFIQDDASQIDISDQELDNYMNKTLDYDINSNVFIFWDQNMLKFPRLYRIANRLLSVSATNLSSERNFSATRLTLTDNRSNLNPESVNHLLFIRSNFDMY